MTLEQRTDTDTWDPGTSVGATATLVAAARAAAAASPDALIDDPLAKPLVHAVGVAELSRWADGDIDDEDPDVQWVLRGFVDLMAVRTRFFDDFLQDATDAGIRQVVNLASGLDARSYRMAWPAGTRIFELDQAPVIGFKTSTLADLGVDTSAELHAVPIDLRQDWPAALRANGFDAQQPTVWLIEGLLPFLRPDAQDRLLDAVTELSVAGSRLGAEIFVPPSRELMEPVTRRWQSSGFSVQPQDLVYDEDRSDVTVYLNAHGWSATTTTMRTLLARHGLSRRADDPLFTNNSYYTATRI